MSEPTSRDETLATAFLNGENAAFVAQIYQAYLADPGSVDPSWADYFRGLGDGAEGLAADFEAPTWAADAPSPRAQSGAAGSGPTGGGTTGAGRDPAAIHDSLQLLLMIRNFRVLGHLQANLDPLGLIQPINHPDLDPKTYGFGPEDMDREIFIDGHLGFETATVRQVLDLLRQVYCGSIGTQFMHISEPEEKRWLQARLEGDAQIEKFTDKGRETILARLTEAEAFEKFLDKKFRGTKRFGLDGGETTIPALEQIVKQVGKEGVEEVVIGMAHRGRLNVLANFMKKPYRAIFSEFLGTSANPEDIDASGDVKYHLGASADLEFDDRVVHLSLTANPSHLEAVNPVVVGKVRAKMDQRGDMDRRKVLGLLLHGDAAFAGQGLVPETIDLAGLRGYRTGGTIHFITNNQIGFTTNPVNARSGPYCTEVAKIVEAPILHVNGDDPEAVVHACRIAASYRQKFQKDVVVDMFCYRRFGHNEGDEPMFSQPLMYKKIKAQRTTRELYAQDLADRGIVPLDVSTAMLNSALEILEEEFEAAQSYRPNEADWLKGRWVGFEPAEKQGARRGLTSISKETYETLAQGLVRLPNDFVENSKITRLMKTKSAMFDTGEGFDWGTAENMAFGSLLLEGNSIRMSGQDVRRGTFSHRHAAILDQETDEAYLPMNHMVEGQAQAEIVNSPLSEFAVLGFEYGYSLAEPNSLTIWEAQFGDFANGAQVMIDQFIASGEEKWLRMSGLVMLLPHGYEGQGPEHSSARVERFLQLCAEDNMQVLNCTTPANYFHALRRQLRRDFRKPLVVMTPKSLLRHKLAVSAKSDFVDGSSFHRVQDDLVPMKAKAIKRVILCSGKVYYDLHEARAAAGLEDSVHIFRVEQLYPFPADALQEMMAPLAKASFIWCQEEPKNMGAWQFIAPELENVLINIDAKHSRPVYAGRKAAASPATGSAAAHKRQQEALVAEALGLKIA